MARQAEQVENPEQQQLQTIPPGIGPPTQQRIEQQDFEQVHQDQQDSGTVEQHFERPGERRQQIDDHHQPEQQGNDLAQPHE
ncbi:hypothetical protein D3C72_2280640 [compost metagenome]